MADTRSRSKAAKAPKSKTLKAAKSKSAEPVRRKRMSAEERREQILAVATQVFLEDGLAGARTKDIAEGVGVAEAILYRHFDSKTEIFEAAILEPLQELVQGMLQKANEFAQLDRAGRKSQSLVIHETMLTAMKQVVPLLGVALFSELEGGESFYRDRLGPLLDRINDVNERSLLGYSHPNMDSAVLSKMLIGSYVWIALDAYFRGTEIDVDSTARQISRFFVRGMSGRPEAGA